MLADSPELHESALRGFFLSRRFALLLDDVFGFGGHGYLPVLLRFRSREMRNTREQHASIIAFTVTDSERGSCHRMSDAAFSRFATWITATEDG